MHPALKQKKIIIPAILAITIIAIILIVFVFAAKKTNPNEIVLYGNVDIRQVDLGFRVSGRIQTMHFEEGDAVKAGDILAELDPVPYQNDLALANAQLSESAANLAKMQHGSRPEEIEQARANVNEQQAASENAQALFNRQQQLVQSGAISKQDFDNAKASQKEAFAALQVAKENLALSLAGFRKEDIDAAQASLMAAQAQIAIANTNLQDTKIIAPNDGYILTRILESGAIVSPGTAAYTLSLGKPVWVRAYIPEPDLGHVKPGMKVDVYNDSHTTPLSGQVGYISSQAEFTPKNVETPELRTNLVYRLRVTVDDPKGQLRQGMPVTIKIHLAAHNE